MFTIVKGVILLAVSLFLFIPTMITMLKTQYSNVGAMSGAIIVLALAVFNFFLGILFIWKGRAEIKLHRRDLKSNEAKSQEELIEEFMDLERELEEGYQESSKEKKPSKASKKKEEKKPSKASKKKEEKKPSKTSKKKRRKKSSKRKR